MAEKSSVSILNEYIQRAKMWGLPPHDLEFGREVWGDVYLLKASSYKGGLLLHFSTTRLEIKRIAN